MTNLKGAIASGSIIALLSLTVFALVLLNSNTESAVVNLTTYQIRNVSAVVNGSNVDGGGTTTLIEANDTSVQITINVTMQDAADNLASNLINISSVTITIPTPNIAGRSNFTYQASSNNTTATAPVLSQFFNVTRGGDFNDVSVSNVINLTWNVTAGWTAGLMQNTSAGGLAGNTSRNFTFNLSTTPNATAIHVFNVSTLNGTAGAFTVTGGAYNVSAFVVQTVDTRSPINLIAVDGPYGSQRVSRNRVFNESPNAINATNNLTVAINFTITEPLLVQAGMQVCVNATSTDSSTANSTCFNVTGTPFKSLNTGFVTAQTGFPTGQSGMYNLSFFAYDNGTAGTDTQGGNANFSRSSLRNTTFFWIVDDTAPTVGLTVTQGGVNVDGKAAVAVDSSLKIDCTTASDGHSGILSSSLEITEPDGKKITDKSCGDTYTPKTVKSTVEAYKIEYSLRNGANLNSTATVKFGTDYASKSSTPGSGSGAAPVANPDVLASKTLTAVESAKPDKPLELTPPAEIISQGLTKLQITVSQEVAAADAKVDVKALKQIPTTDESGQTLTALPSSSQIALKVLQITPSATLKASTTKATLTFTLTKAELGTTNPSEIVLARFAGGQWVELPTTAGTPKEDGSVEFTAETPGFSVFVVTTKAPAVLQEPEGTAAPSTPSTGGSNTKPTVAPEPAAVATGGLSGMALYGIVAVVVVIILAVVGFTLKKKQ